VTTLFSFLFVLGVLVFVHELGHFLVARFYGVRVLTFSLGFGPKLLKYRANAASTEYCVSAVPLGGYVKLAGESVDEERSGAPDEFMSKSKWVRFQVYLAGPTMNVLLAWVLMAVVLSRGAEVPLYETSAPVVGSFSPASSAQAGGMQVGDRIVRIAGRDVATWNDLMEAVGQKPNQDLPVDVRRGTQTMTLHLTPRLITYKKFDVGDLGVLPVLRPQLDQITPGGAAAKAGLQPGDVVIAVNGQHGLDREAIVKQLQGSAGKPIVFTVERAGENLDVSVTPVERGGVGIIGVALIPYEVRRIAPGWRHAAGLSLQENWDRAAMIGRTLRGLVTAQTPINQLMGPVAIAQQSGEFAALGWISLLDFMAMISLNLGLINLMPVPVMDGGQIAILALEGVSRREMSSRLKEKILLAGAALVVLLMVTVIYNDVMRLVR
jgi:regulator of sigma E protease